MLKKIIILSSLFTFTIFTVNFADAGHYSSNIIMPKTPTINPLTGIQPPVQNYSSNQVNANSTTQNPPTQQLTPEQLFELQKQQALQNLSSTLLDIPSGFTADGFAYGLARLAHNLALKRGEVTFKSATKIKDKQYYVVCESLDRYANGTFLVDLYPPNEAELKDGYQIWFTLYDINAKKIGTAQAKKMHN